LPYAKEKTSVATGYEHAGYARSFAEWGTPRLLGHSQGWALERPVAGANDCRDAMGCYPLFSCPDWSKLGSDLSHSGDFGWISLALVTDPFAQITREELQRAFPDLMREYKEHFVIELGRAPSEFVHPHHLRNARRAASDARIQFGEPTQQLLETWVALYGELIARHEIRGFAAFSPVSFAGQFEVPGLTIQWAELEGRIAGMLLWYTIGDRAYYHLGAYSEQGYAARCSFALFLAAIDHFAAAGAKWICLGAGAGATNDGTDGLTRFKRGWATGTRGTYLCGRIFDRTRYDELCSARGTTQTPYFPAYRSGEFR